MPRARARRHRLFGWRSTWGRWFALIALAFALPASEHLVRELVSLACEVSGDGCADGCDDGAGVCLDGCGHCACCQPPMAPAVVALSVSTAPSQREVAWAAPIDEPPPGIVAGPFRPPTS